MIINQNLRTTKNYITGYSRQINNTLNLHLRNINKLSQRAFKFGLNTAPCINKKFWKQLDGDIFNDMFKCLEVRLINGNSVIMEESANKLEDIVDNVKVFNDNIKECGINLIDHPCSTKILPYITLLSNQMPNDASNVIDNIFKLIGLLNDDIFTCAAKQINLLNKINEEASNITLCLSNLISNFKNVQ